MRLKHSTDGDIPIIDISPFFSGHRAKKKEVAKKLVVPVRPPDS